MHVYTDVLKQAHAFTPCSIRTIVQSFPVWSQARLCFRLKELQAFISTEGIAEPFCAWETRVMGCDNNFMPDFHCLFFSFFLSFFFTTDLVELFHYCLAMIKIYIQNRITFIQWNDHYNDTFLLTNHQFGCISVYGGLGELFMLTYLFCYYYCYHSYH